MHNFLLIILLSIENGCWAYISANRSAEAATYGSFFSIPRNRHTLLNSRLSRNYPNAVYRRLVFHRDFSPLRIEYKPKLIVKLANNQPVVKTGLNDGLVRIIRRRKKVKKGKAFLIHETDKSYVQYSFEHALSPPNGDRQLLFRQEPRVMMTTTTRRPILMSFAIPRPSLRPLPRHLYYKAVTVLPEFYGKHYRLPPLIVFKKKHKGLDDFRT